MNPKTTLIGGLLAAWAWAAPAALLGVAPQDPKIDFGGSGVVNYAADTQSPSVTGTPATLIRNDPFLFGTFGGTGPTGERSIKMQLHVNEQGRFVSGVDGQADVQVVGSVDVDFDGVDDYSGVLLEAEVLFFGWQDGPDGGDDAFDMLARITGGQLLPLYDGPYLAIVVVSEASAEFPNPFSGRFDSNWSGHAKGVLGAYDGPVNFDVAAPAAAWMVLGGLVALGVCRRRVRAAAQARVGTPAITKV